MNYSRSKSTKRFKFNVSRNTISHKSGANTVTISGRDYDQSSKGSGYATGTGTFASGQNLTMTVKEAKAFQKFLNTHLQD